MRSSDREGSRDVLAEYALLRGANLRSLFLQAAEGTDEGSLDRLIRTMDEECGITVVTHQHSGGPAPSSVRGDPTNPSRGAPAAASRPTGSRETPAATARAALPARVDVAA
jgi:hypothetical protein